MELKKTKTSTSQSFTGEYEGYNITFNIKVEDGVVTELNCTGSKPPIGGAVSVKSISALVQPVGDKTIFVSGTAPISENIQQYIAETFDEITEQVMEAK